MKVNKTYLTIFSSILAFLTMFQYHTLYFSIFPRNDFDVYFGYYEDNRILVIHTLALIFDISIFIIFVFLFARLKVKILKILNMSGIVILIFLMLLFPFEALVSNSVNFQHSDKFSIFFGASNIGIIGIILLMPMLVFLLYNWLKIYSIK